MTLTANNIKRSIKQQRAFAFWLLLCASLVFCMIVLGGATRLTGSGLSMVDWSLVNDLLPPFTPEAWQQRFLRYQQFPEFQLVYPDMNLHGFKKIFWLEYLHRLLGRIMALAFLLPLLWFGWQHLISRRAMIGLILIFGLGVLQAAVGWYMVKSGLVEAPYVSHLRLTTHLGLAVLLFTALLWMGLEELPVIRTRKLHSTKALTVISSTLCVLVIGMILLGALVAGTHAGNIYTTFPTMGDHWIAPTVYASKPLLYDILNNPVTIQFHHRLLAVVLVATILITATVVLRSAKTHPLLRRNWTILLGVVLGQFALGVTTLVNHAPPLLSLAHQTGAMVLLTSTLTCCHLCWQGQKSGV